MIAFAEKVIAYTDGLDQEHFVASSLNYDATVRNLELIDEAATRVPDDLVTLEMRLADISCSPISYNSPARLIKEIVSDPVR